MVSESFGNIMLVFGVFCALGLLALFVISTVWAYRDAQTRGKSGCMWALIIFFTWPIGLLAYWLLRDQNVQL